MLTSAPSVLAMRVTLSLPVLLARTDGLPTQSPAYLLGLAQVSPPLHVVISLKPISHAYTYVHMHTHSD